MQIPREPYAPPLGGKDPRAMCALFVCQTKDQTASVEVVDAGRNTPATVVNEQQATPEPALPQNEKREFLQGMSPPSSPGGFPRNSSPVALATEKVATETKISLPAALRKGDGVGPRADGGVVAGPLVAPSNGGRRTGEGGKLMEGGGGGGSARASRRSVEQIFQSEESQVGPCLGG